MEGTAWNKSEIVLKGDLDQIASGLQNTFLSPNNLLSIKQDISGNTFDIDLTRVRHMIYHVIYYEINASSLR